MTKQTTSSPVKVFLLIILIGLLAGTVWFVRHNKDQATPQIELQSQVNTDATANWIDGSNSEGLFSYKHSPNWRTKACESTTLLAASTNAIGECASSYFGQVSIASYQGNRDEDFILNPSQFTDFTKTVVTIDGIQGSVSKGIAKVGIPAPHESDASYPAGTTVQQYVFYANNDRTYVIRYLEQPGFADIRADFETLVTKTLTFQAKD